jgi:hypothetical protein
VVLIPVEVLAFRFRRGVDARALSDYMLVVHGVLRPICVDDEAAVVADAGGADLLEGVTKLVEQLLVAFIPLGALDNVVYPVYELAVLVATILHEFIPEIAADLALLSLAVFDFGHILACVHVVADGRPSNGQCFGVNVDVLGYDETGAQEAMAVQAAVGW